MEPALFFLAACLAFLSSSQLCRAQGETALPFLLITSSPEGNGMGGIVGTIPGDNPMAILANPGKLGITALDNYFLGGFYPSSTNWLPVFGPGPTYSASAFSAGINLNRPLRLPLALSIGVGYSHVSLNYGLFAETSPNDPSIVGYFQPEEHPDNWSVAIGADYCVRLGLGYTSKSVVSSLAPFDVQGSGKPGVANVSTYDWGVIAQAPLFGIVGQLSGSPVIFWGSVHPLLDVTVGYARRNLGDTFVSYIDPAQGDPLPRSAMLGISYKAGFALPARTGSWEAFSFTLAR